MNERNQYSLLLENGMHTHKIAHNSVLIDSSIPTSFLAVFRAAIAPLPPLPVATVITHTATKHLQGSF